MNTTKAKKADKKKKVVIEEEEWESDDQEEEQKDQGDSTTLYKLLNVPKTATIDEIKKSYKTLALKLHPDKNKDDPEATNNFQKLSEAYKILIDPEKREMYDKTGSVEDADLSGFTEAYNFYRSMYPKIEKEDIEAFSKKYRFSEEEAQDVVNYYEENKGDVTLLLETIMLSENEDIERFVKLLEEKIENGELKKYAKWDKTKKKVKPLADESEEFQRQQEESLKELSKNILAKRQNNTSNLFAALEKKYGGKGKNDPYDIDEEEFQRIQSKMGKKKAQDDVSNIRKKAKK